MFLEEDESRNDRPILCRDVLVAISTSTVLAVRSTNVSLESVRWFDDCRADRSPVSGSGRCCPGPAAGRQDPRSHCSHKMSSIRRLAPSAWLRQTHHPRVRQSRAVEPGSATGMSCRILRRVLLKPALVLGAAPAAHSRPLDLGLQPDIVDPQSVDPAWLQSAGYWPRACLHSSWHRLLRLHLPAQRLCVCLCALGRGVSMFVERSAWPSI